MLYKKWWGKKSITRKQLLVAMMRMGGGSDKGDGVGEDKEEDVDVSEEKKEDATKKKGKKGEPNET